MQDAGTITKEWLVVDGQNILYRGPSCGAAVTVIDQRQLRPTSLFQSSPRMVDLLRDMLPTTE